MNELNVKVFGDKNTFSEMLLHSSKRYYIIAYHDAIVNAISILRRADSKKNEREKKSHENEKKTISKHSIPLRSESVE